MCKQEKISTILVVHKTENEENIYEIINSLSKTGELILVSEIKLNKEITDGLLTVVYNPGELTAGLNEAVHLAKQPWIFYIESDEKFENGQIKDIDLKSGYSYYVKITSGKGEEEKVNYSVRIFPATDKKTDPFHGNVKPDLTDFIYKNKLKVEAAPFSFTKSGAFLNLEHTEALLDINPVVAMDYFWQAIIYAEKQKFYKAEKLFRRSLNSEYLLKFNHLAALNGLALSLLEQHRLDKAFEIADQSAELSARQYTPWILMHKICWMQSDWMGAYQHLARYLEMRRYQTEACFDIRLSESDANYLLAEVSLYEGKYDHAFVHLEKFFELNNGDVSDEIPEKLFIYAAELKLKEKAKLYFNEIYTRHILEKPDEQVMSRMLETLSLIENNGWNDFASTIYERMIAVYPGNHKILQGWLTSLIRSNQLQKAKVLMENIKKKKPVHVAPVIE
ncbi:MAG: tetratricopeptide repeat protein [Balneolaceae bacterium]